MMSHQRLAALIQAHQGALLAHPETSATHEAMISFLQRVDDGEITPAQGVRLLCYQAVVVAEAPAYAALYRQAPADLRKLRACGAVNRPNLDDAGTQGPI